MEEKPKVKPEIKKADYFIEILSWVAVLFLLINTFRVYSGLPSTIPTHFNLAGEADDFGGKGTILILPLLVVIIFVGLTILIRFPYNYNYPVKITAENAIRQYANATRMLRFLKLVFVIVFSLLTTMIIQTAKGHSEGLGFWFLPFSLGMVFIPLSYFIIIAFRLK